MTLQEKTKSKLSETKQSQAIQKELTEYQDYFFKAKGFKPNVIRVTKDQLKKLGVDDKFYFNGSYLELLK